MKRIISIVVLLLICTGCEEKQIYTADFLSFNKIEFEYGSYVMLSDIIDNKNIKLTNKQLDTSILGNNKLDVSYSYEDQLFTESFNYNVVDNTKPFVWLSGSKTITVGYEGDIAKDILCADNYDRTPTCTIEGYYDTNIIGSYNLTHVAKDDNGNESRINFVLYVKEKSPQVYAGSQDTFIALEDVIAEHKNEKTMIGIDVSYHQGKINWEEVKNAGIEFAMIRVGYQKGFEEDNVLDPTFEYNITEALKNNIQVGIYFYSYATTTEEAIAQANFVIKNVKDYNISFPIAFDWENFSWWNELELNLLDIKNISSSFQNTIKKAGYDPIQYDSKYNLMYFWTPANYDIWLAHYISKTNYEGNYIMWQLCNTGRVPGINGNVDINVYYLD